MKNTKIFSILLLISLLFSFNLYANETEQTSQYNQKAQTMLETILLLEKNGYITPKNAIEAKKEFIFSKSELLQKDIKVKNTTNNEINWTDYISLINIFKLIAIICLLIALKGTIFKFIEWFKKIPIYIYQVTLLCLSLTLTFYPDIIWLSEAKYLSIFGIVANIIILGWIISTYEDFFEKLFKYISLNFPIEIMTSIYLTLYFGLFAIYVDSYFLGIIASITFVSIFGFFMNTTGLSTYIGYDKEDLINQSLLSCLVIVVAYSIINIMGIHIPYLNIFSIGIEYVLTIVLVVTLIIKTSYAFENDKMFSLNIFLFVMLFILSTITSFVFHLSVIPAIINTGFIIFLLGWLHYFTIKISGILTMFVAAITLYLTALLLEHYPEYFVTVLF